MTVFALNDKIIYEYFQGVIVINMAIHFRLLQIH